MVQINLYLPVLVFLTAIACAHGFCIDDGEICLTKRNSTAVTCNLKPDIKEIKEILLNVTSEIMELKNKLGKVEATCQKQSSVVSKDCSDIRKKGEKNDGVYTIDPDGKGSFEVFCDMKTSGGGWTVFQKRRDGSVNFYRGWQDYKKGFGNVSDEFWLGLEKIHRLTQSKRKELRIDLGDFSGTSKYVKYRYFAIADEGQKYKLSLGYYSGNAGDSFSEHNGMAFTTKDADNDTWVNNCAVTFKGAWWYNKCHRSNLNGVYYHGKHSSFADGINWYNWKGYHYSLKKASMKLRPI